MELFFFGLLVGALFMHVWVCIVGAFTKPPPVIHYIDIAESNRQASYEYARKRCADHNYMMAALKDD
jgi:hypothetical protein